MANFISTYKLYKDYTDRIAQWLCNTAMLYSGQQESPFPPPHFVRDFTTLSNYIVSCIKASHRLGNNDQMPQMPSRFKDIDNLLQLTIHLRKDICHKYQQTKERPNDDADSSHAYFITILEDIQNTFRNLFAVQPSAGNVDIQIVNPFAALELQESATSVDDSELASIKLTAAALHYKPLDQKSDTQANVTQDWRLRVECFFKDLNILSNKVGTYWQDYKHGRQSIFEVTLLTDCAVVMAATLEQDLKEHKPTNVKIWSFKYLINEYLKSNMLNDPAKSNTEKSKHNTYVHFRCCQHLERELNRLLVSFREVKTKKPVRSRPFPRYPSEGEWSKLSIDENVRKDLEVLQFIWPSLLVLYQMIEKRTIAMKTTKKHKLTDIHSIDTQNNNELFEGPEQILPQHADYFTQKIFYLLDTKDKPDVEAIFATRLVCDIFHTFSLPEGGTPDSGSKPENKTQNLFYILDNQMQKLYESHWHQCKESQNEVYSRGGKDGIDAKCSCHHCRMVITSQSLEAKCAIPFVSPDPRKPPEILSQSTYGNHIMYPYTLYNPWMTGHLISYILLQDIVYCLSIAESISKGGWQVLNALYQTQIIPTEDRLHRMDECLDLLSCRALFRGTEPPKCENMTDVARATMLGTKVKGGKHVHKLEERRVRKIFDAMPPILRGIIKLQTSPNDRMNIFHQFVFHDESTSNFKGVANVLDRVLLDFNAAGRIERYLRLNCVYLARSSYRFVTATQSAFLRHCHDYGDKCWACKIENFKLEKSEFYDLVTDHCILTVDHIDKLFSGRFKRDGMEASVVLREKLIEAAVESREGDASLDIHGCHAIRKIITSKGVCSL